MINNIASWSHRRKYFPWTKNTIKALAICLGMITAQSWLAQDATNADIVSDSVETVDETQTKKDILYAFCSDIIHKYGKEKALELIRYYMIQEINAIRKGHWLNPLKIDSTLEKVAQDYAVYMAKNNHYSHNDIQWRDVSYRLKEAGYTGSRRWENLSPSNTPSWAIGSEEYKQGWMWSTWHREVILRSDVNSLWLWYAHRSGETSIDEDNYFVLIVGKK